MKYVMAERQSVNDVEKPPNHLNQTTEEVARAAVAAAAAVRPRPSIVVSSKYQSANNFHKWRRSLQKAFKWGTGTRERDRRNLFNPELLTRQKRQWSELQLQALEKKQTKKERVCFFEHFVVVGLHPSANVEATEVAFAKKKAWQRDSERSEWLGGDAKTQHRGPPQPTLEPQVLFKYPPGKRLPLKSKDLPAFCFPSGVEARLMERTPSMSELNEVMYGQSHQKRDDQSFIFLLKVADNVTLYGVCVLVTEIVQRLPGILAMNTAQSPPRSQPSRFLVSAPRCYCFLTKLPFFNLHFEVLNSIIAQERLDRITQCVNEMTLAQHVPSMVEAVSKGSLSSPGNEDDPDGWMESAIPVDSVLGATAAAAGLISEKDVPSFSSKSSGPLSPDGHLTSLSPTSVTGADGKDSNGYRDTDNVLPEEERQEGEDQGLNSMGRLAVELKNIGNGSKMVPSSSERELVRMGHERMESSESIYSVFESSVRSMDSDDDGGDDETSPFTEEDCYGSQAVLSWAEANNNDSLRLVCAYHRTPVPKRGETTVFHPLEHLQPMNFSRSGEIPASLMGIRLMDRHACRTSLEVAEVQAAVMAGEEALSISTWAVATVCRALSLDNVLTLFAGALLEKQMVVICPNLGVLSAVVMSLIPMIRPYEWQSLLLPILPNKMLDFLEAPVPFIVGVQHKTHEVRVKSANLIRVNVYKDKVTASYMPQLPRHRELFSTLEPYYNKLAAEQSVAKRHPIHEFNEVQAQASEGFLAVLQNYLESLCMDLRAHTITNVQSNDDKVSLLLKESFIDSFGSRDRPFIKLFADTQLFSVYTDAVLSSYQNS
ncbi:hypothetical protein MPTK1_8g12990 [Marchantia polymorpha subsp. ruderalis]|nr:hypothetical protein MARPO_0083s0022 [Marchantia polymorpha]BBN19714.1 hypothetical protein Mp_8g12990 [Marchantia polymorpha subsp. ruderalis]|eukprot:PTQ34053.1 hypothetical protein MARPO_0083s0022 [Marchantia polymorpha]